MAEVNRFNEDNSSNNERLDFWIKSYNKLFGAHDFILFKSEGKLSLVKESLSGKRETLFSRKWCIEDEFYNTLSTHIDMFGIHLEWLVKDRQRKRVRGNI